MMMTLEKQPFELQIQEAWHWKEIHLGEMCGLHFGELLFDSQREYPILPDNLEDTLRTFDGNVVVAVIFWGPSVSSSPVDWNVRKMNEEVLSEELETGKNEVLDGAGTAEDLPATPPCPRSRCHEGRKAAYWCTDKIAGLRKNRDVADEALLEYRRAVRGLKFAINKGKCLKWEELRHNLGSLLPSPIMDTEKMEHIVDTLFPTHPMRDLDVHAVPVQGVRDEIQLGEVGFFLSSCWATVILDCTWTGWGNGNSPWYDAEPTFFKCRRRTEERRKLMTQLQEDLQLQNIIGVMLRGQECWNMVAKYMEKILRVVKVSLDETR
ncbi:hypothetical protein J6590_034481 [Homalodisca vitripennis]|nr:hypothetical protein J6590_034481 [Homalodisca vitripennis]